MAPAMEAPSYFQGVVKESPAFRLMKQMGWEEGNGLGKAKQGIKQHLKVKNKQDTSGIGIDAQKKAESIWTFNTTTFDSILKNLNVQAAGTESTELPSADRIGEPSITNGLQIKKPVRPQGRYKKRESGKLVQSYSQTDLNAILGNIDQNSLNSGNSAGVHVEQHPIHEICERNLGSFEKVCLMVDEPKYKEEVDWWGHKHGFVKGGVLGNCKDEEQDIQKTINEEHKDATQLRPSFSERDQEALYKLVQDKATTGKQGLGKGVRLKTVSGSFWTGQKINFNAQSDDEADGKQGTCSSDRLAAVQSCDAIFTDKALMNCEPRKRKRGNISADNVQHGKVIWKQVQVGNCRAEDGDTVEGSKISSVETLGAINWKRICRTVLMKAPDYRMSVRRLYKRLKHELNLTDNEATSTSMDLLKFREKIQKSSKFNLNGSKVYLNI